MNKLQLYFIALILFPHFSFAQLTINVTPQTQCFSSSTNSVTAVVMVGPPSAIGYSWTILPALSICISANSITVISPTMAVYRFGCCGTYTLNCSAYASGGALITSTTVVVSLVCPPNFNATANSPLICTGGTSTLSASGTGTYSWSTGTNGSQAVVSPSSASVYTVTGTFSGGCTVTRTVGVNIFSPSVQVSPPSTTVCSGVAVNLIGSGAVSYTWNTGGGFNMPFQIVSVSPTVSTVYTVAATSASNNVMCVSTNTMGVTVVGTLTISASSSPTAVCGGKPATLIAQGATGYTWTNALYGPTVTVAIPLGAEQVTFGVIAGSGTCISAQVVVTVKVLSGPTISIVPSTTAVCKGGVITLSASGAPTYTWNSTILSNSFTLSPLSNTIVSVSSTGTNGCISTLVYTVPVNPLPTISIVPSKTPICSAEQVTLTASGAVSYTWSNNVAASSITFAASAGTYSVIGTAANTCTNTSSYSLAVLPAASITAVSNKTLICAGEKILLTPGGGTSYTWAPIAGSGTLSLSPITTTQYTLSGENSSGCVAMALLTVTVNKCQGLNNEVAEKKVKVYPNPASKELILDTPEHATITVYNIDGQVLFQNALKGTHHKIDISNFNAGCYFMSIQSVSTLETIRFVKE